jgi:trimethylguanosine synthase
MEPYSLKTLYAGLSSFTEHMVFYLPRTSDLRELAEMVSDGRKAAVMHYCVEGASKALCVYYGGFNVESLSV